MLVLLVSTIALTFTTLFVPGGQVTVTVHRLVVTELFAARATVIIPQPNVESLMVTTNGRVEELWTVTR